MNTQSIRLLILILQLKHMLDKSFQEIFYRINNWINSGSGWIIESIDGEYVNVSAYNPLIERTY